jgi:hypothetical protein
VKLDNLAVNTTTPTSLIASAGNIRVDHCRNCCRASEEINVHTLSSNYELQIRVCFVGLKKPTPGFTSYVNERQIQTKESSLIQAREQAGMYVSSSQNIRNPIFAKGSVPRQRKLRVKASRHCGDGNLELGICIQSPRFCWR